MMKMKNISLKVLVIALLFVFIGSEAKAQQWYGAFSYQVSFPTGDTKEFADDISFIGFALDFRNVVARNTTVGVLLGWNVFHERTDETIQLMRNGNPGAVTGLQDRTINSFPIMANFHRYFGEPSGKKFFVGLNAGGYYMVQRFDIGIYTFQEDEWQWGIIPEIGMTIPLQRTTSLIISGKYHFAFTGDSPVGGDIKHQYISIGVGIAWTEY